MTFLNEHHKQRQKIGILICISCALLFVLPPPLRQKRFIMMAEILAPSLLSYHFFVF